MEKGKLFGSHGLQLFHIILIKPNLACNETTENNSIESDIDLYWCEFLKHPKASFYRFLLALYRLGAAENEI